MRTLDTHPGKSPGYSDEKPARIVLTTGDEYEVAHHFLTEREQWVCAYETTRNGGIDYRFPAAAIAVIDTTTDSHDDSQDVEPAPSFESISDEDVEDLPSLFETEVPA